MPELPPAAGVPRILTTAACANVLMAAGAYLSNESALIVAGLANAALLLVASRVIVQQRIIERAHHEVVREHWRRERG